MKRIFLYLLVSISLVFWLSPSQAKDRSLANKYQIILEVDKEGYVSTIQTEGSVPKPLVSKIRKAFLNKDIGQRIIEGQPINYQQKLIVSTKHLFRDSKVSSR